MNNKFLIFTIIAMSSCIQQPVKYPETRKVDVSDNYFGTMVADPYRWLEDDRSAETEKWVKAQNEVTFEYFSRIPFRDSIRKRIQEIWNYPRMTAPRKDGGYYFITRNNGLQNQDVYFIMHDLDSEPVLFLDPNSMSEDGTVAITEFDVSEDGKYLGYGISRAGSDWQEFFVRDMHTGADLADHLKWIKHSGISWYKDGFFYSRFESPEAGTELSGENLNNKVYYHKIGTNQDKDKVIFEKPEYPNRSFNTITTKDEKYLFVVEIESTSGNALHFKVSGDPDSEWETLVSGFDHEYLVVDNLGPKLLVRTNNGAPKYKLAVVDLENPEKKFTDLIPEAEHKVMTSCKLGGDKIIVQYMKDAQSQISIFDFNGKYLNDIELPGPGTVVSIHAEKNDYIAFYTFTSFTVPSLIFRYDLKENVSELYYKSEIDFDYRQYETKQVFYPGRDGTMIPMFIVSKKGIELDGNNPAYLYGYGGFNIILEPSFSVGRLIWLENGGIYAQANLRGGGEYGEEWHKAGTILNKQNVFDDFIAAAGYLIGEKYTSPDKLVIHGASNGGLLVGAVINQRPDLFRVAFPDVGVMDMLRFHKFTIGRYWVVDYGSSEDSVQFEYLYKYSPLHNIRSGVDYPAIMITTADHDDRVVPAHSFKYAATLQEKYNGPNPVIIRIETEAGHGAGMPVKKIIEELADRYAFAFYNIGIKPIY